MRESFEAGQPVAVVVRRPGQAETWEGTAAAVTQHAVGVVLRRPLPPNPGTVLLVRGKVGSRAFAPASFVQVLSGTHIFRIEGEWRSFDVRASKRFAVDMPVLVTSTLGGSRQAGRAVDISSGGMAATVPAKPGGDAVELTLQADGFSARLPAIVVRADDHPRGCLLRLQFRGLTLAQQAFVRNLIGRLQQDDIPQRKAS